MAPIPPSIASLVASQEEGLSDPFIRSLKLDTTPSLQRRDAETTSTTSTTSTTLSPLEAHDLAKRTLYSRSLNHPNVNPGAGANPPATFNNQAFLALFATLGALMVLASLWFFFWAKNGGFKFTEDDWDDYKSTVLRRKGPDGRTLSNATKSTKLGGSTIAGTQHFKWAKQEAKSVVSYDEKGRKGILGKRGWAKTHSVTYKDDYMTDSFGTETVSDMTEVRDEPRYETYHSKRYRDRDVDHYKKEKPARVGGLNRVADGNGSQLPSTVNGSDMYSQVSGKPILQRDEEKKKQNAERRAREEAAKMEKRWKRDAEEQAAAHARESARSIPQPRKAASPTKPSPGGARQRSASRSASPKKRQSAGPSMSEVPSAAYTGTTGNHSASYYDSYRPRAESTDYGNRSSPRQSSPKKQPRASQGGYRRGADLDF